jgi:hypothetical protein
MPTPLREPNAGDTLYGVATKIGQLLFAVVRGDKGVLVRGNVNVAAAAVAVTPSDTVDLATVAKALYIGGAGDVKVLVGGEEVVFKAVPVGTVLPVAAQRVFATGTGASFIVALN